MLKNAPIVILGEATANVDPENEDRLQKAIEALTRDKTIIMIAHRLKTVRHADQILVIDRGRIVQQGTHEQLIREPGMYADFVGGKKQTVGWKLKKIHAENRQKPVLRTFYGHTVMKPLQTAFPPPTKSQTACRKFPRLRKYAQKAAKG